MIYKKSPGLIIFKHIFQKKSIKLSWNFENIYFAACETKIRKTNFQRLLCTFIWNIQIIFLS